MLTEFPNARGVLDSSGMSLISTYPGGIFTWLKPGKNHIARILLLLLLPAALCLLPAASSQNQVPPAPSPSPSPAPSPSPSPTPPPNLHQWGAVTSFHGLPSDRTHAIAQTEYGVTWFATDGGLARYDGRRTNAINDEALPSGRVLALKADEDGALWVGTDNGAARLAHGKFERVPETGGKIITAIITPERGRAIIASEAGQIFDCRVQAGREANEQSSSSEGRGSQSFSVKTIPEQPLPSADKDHPGTLKFTSLAMVGDKLFAATESRGLVQIENGEIREIVSRPRSFFINTLETDARGKLWVGARAGKDDLVSAPLRSLQRCADPAGISGRKRYGHAHAAD